MISDWVMMKVRMVVVLKFEHLFMIYLSHMRLKHASKEKKIAHGKFFDFRAQNVYRIRFQKIKIKPLKGFEKKAFF